MIDPEGKSPLEVLYLIAQAYYENAVVLGALVALAVAISSPPSFKTFVKGAMAGIAVVLVASMYYNGAPWPYHWFLSGPRPLIVLGVSVIAAGVGMGLHKLWTVAHRNRVLKYAVMIALALGVGLTLVDAYRLVVYEAAYSDAAHKQLLERKQDAPAP